MKITALIKLEIAESDHRLLERMANAAGKTRDAFVCDYIRQMLLMERDVRAHNYQPDGDAA